MARARNPFISGRIEFEHNPVLYMPDDILDWVSRKPLLFEGPRGSGKSSILKSLTWEVAWKVSDITVRGSEKVSELFRDPSHIGVYYRVEDMETDYWRRWHDVVGRDAAERYFGTYVDFLYVDLLLNALEQIRNRDERLRADGFAETRFVADMVRECFPSASRRPRLAEESFGWLRSVVADTHIGIRTLVYGKKSEREIRDTYAVVSPGSLVRAFGAALMKHYPALSDWTIMPLLDDCNFLEEWQVVIVNAAIAKAAIPVAYKLTSVAGLYPTRRTLTSARTVVEHDIQTVAVPGGSSADKACQDFADWVCRTRVGQRWDEEAGRRFRLKKVLGPYNLERVLAQKLAESEKDECLQLVRQAEQEDSAKPVASVTGVWLSQKGVRKQTEVMGMGAEAERRLRRRISSAYKKKWNHVAAVALCKEFRLDFPYCGWKVVLHLSCRSIREVLRIMWAIWDEARLSIEDFVSGAAIEARIQNRAIHKVAKATFDAIDPKPVAPGVTLPEICIRLGELFTKCQTYPYILATPETAAIRVNVREFERRIKDVEKRERIDEIIEAAMTAGIMLKQEQGDDVALGLHPILAPRFGISFRSPFYYPQRVSPEDLVALFLGDKATASRVKKEILGRRMERYERRAPAGQMDIFDKFNSGARKCGKR